MNEKNLTGNQIRQMFLDFFAEKGFMILKNTGLSLTPSVRETSLPVTY